MSCEHVIANRSARKKKSTEKETMKNLNEMNETEYQHQKKGELASQPTTTTAEYRWKTK